MGRRNYLIEGVSCSGKTSVYRELLLRGFHAINGDTELAYQGDPKTGDPVEGHSHETHIWNVEKVRELVADHRHATTFFCGGSRNFDSFLDLFDGIFVLEIDLNTLNQRLALRPQTEWGGLPAEKELIRRLRETREDLPWGGLVIDATMPVERVVDDILNKCGLMP